MEAASPLVTFDFDGTLSRPDVQEYARELIGRGITVGVVTARYDEMHRHLWEANPTNEDLWKVVEEVGIDPKNVRFTCMRLKHEYLADSFAIWHLDDSPEELNAMIRDSNCHTAAIPVTLDHWKSWCEHFLSVGRLKKTPRELESWES